MAKTDKQQLSRHIVYEIVASVLCGLILLLAMLVDSAVFSTPQCLLIKISPLEDYLFTLFSVQASVATLGIAIVSIITGVTSESYLGISVTEFITSINPAFLTHKRLLIASLLLVVMNYIAISFMWINMCIAILIISVVIDICLVSDVYIIFKGAKKLREDISSFLVEHYDSRRISQLRDELMSAVEANNTLIIEPTLSVLKSIFENETRKRMPQSPVVDQIVNVVSETFKKSVKQHNPILVRKMLTYVHDLYVIANDDVENICVLSLWESISESYYRGLSYLTDDQILEEFDYYFMHEELYKNYFAQDLKKTDCYCLQHFSANAYRALLSPKTNRDAAIRKRIKGALYNLTIYQLLYSDSELTQQEKTIRINELCYLIKAAIDFRDFELIEKFFFESYESNEKDENLNFALVIILIYLYYLAARETISSGKEIQDFAREVLRRNRETLSYFFFNLDIVKFAENHKEHIDDMLWPWGQSDSEDYQPSMIYSAIDDFFIFTVCAEGWDKERLSRMIDVVAPTELYTVYTRFLSETFRDNITALFSEYCKLFAEGESVDDSFHDKLLIMEEVLNEKYHDQVIRKGNDSNLSEDNQREYAEGLSKAIKSFLQKTFSRFRINENKPNIPPLIWEKGCVLLNMQLSNSLINNKHMRHLSDHIVQEIMYIFLNRIRKYVDYQEVESDSRTIQKQLIGMVERTKISPTLAIGHKDAFWREEDPKLLNRYVERLEHIKFPGGHNNYYIIDGRKVEFCINNIRVSYSNVSVDSILEDCQKREDGKYYYSVSNGIYIPFEETEIVQYIQNTEKVITVTADIAYRIFDEKIGAGIRIVHRNKR